MAYVKIIYQNSPSTATPINAQNLNHMDDGIAENDRRLNELETAGVVNKFNGRSGNITPTKGDYDIADIGATDGQDGYVPVWRNSGTEEDPDWGFEMEAQGGSGHTILDADGSEMAQEDSLQFADSFVSDDDVNGKTVVENIKEVAPADYDSATDEGIIVCDDGEDAVIHPSSEDYVEVIGNNVKTYSQLLNDLYDEIDFDKLTTISSVRITYTNGTYEDFQFEYKGSSAIRYFNAFINSSNAVTGSSLYIHSSNSNYNATSGSKSTTVCPTGEKITLYYGNKKSVVDLQTTANRCLLNSGETVESALTYTNSAIAIGKFLGRTLYRKVFEYTEVNVPVNTDVKLTGAVGIDSSKIISISTVLRQSGKSTITNSPVLQTYITSSNEMWINQSMSSAYNNATITIIVEYTD